MQVHFKPKTNLGKWSAWLIFACAVSVALFGIRVALGRRGGDTFFSNSILTITIPILVAVPSGIAAVVTGLISIVRRKERSISVYVAVAFGLVVLLLWLYVAIIFPH